jgi:hypothetical protein
MQAALFWGGAIIRLGKERTAEKPLRRRFQRRKSFWRVLAPWFGPHLMCPLLALRRQMLSLFLSLSFPPSAALSLAPVLADPPSRARGPPRPGRRALLTPQAGPPRRTRQAGPP